MKNTDAGGGVSVPADGWLVELAAGRGETGDVAATGDIALIMTLATRFDACLSSSRQQ